MYLPLPEVFCIKSMPYISSPFFTVTPPDYEPPGFKVTQSVTIIIRLLLLYVMVQNFLFALTVLNQFNFSSPFSYIHYYHDTNSNQLKRC